MSSLRARRDAIVNAAVLACAVIGSAISLSTVDMPDWAWGPDIAAGLVALALLALRKRWPVQIAVATGLMSIFAASAGGPAVLALFSACVHRPPRTALALLGFTLATLPPSIALHPTEGETLLMSMLLALLFCGAVVAWGMFIHARRDLISSLEERAERAEREQELRVEQARQAERARIAREMHDVLAHRISLVSMHAGALEFRPDAPPRDIERAAGVIRASAHQALDELREVIGVLREQSAEGGRPEPPQPTAGDLPALVSEIEEAGMRVRLSTIGVDLEQVPDLTGRTAYRVVQEGLTNARKHAPAATVAVTVTGGRDDGLSVEVRNPLSVARRDAVPGAGTGLVGLVERTTLAGGRLEHGRTDAGDYRLAAWLPWQ